MRRQRLPTVLLVCACAVASGVLASRIWPRSSSAPSLETETIQHNLKLRALEGEGHTPIAVDLHVPAKPQGESGVPLVAFIQAPPRDEPDENLDYAADVGDSMQRRGIATIALTVLPHPSPSMERTASDVANAIAEVMLARRADFTRLTLIGRGDGGSIASVIVRDNLLTDIRVDGVVGLRSAYELGPPPKENKRPANEVPPFLLLTGGDDREPRYPKNARNFAKSLGPSVKTEALVIPHRDEHNLTHWSGEDNDLGELVTAFVTSGPKTFSPETWLGARQRWSKSPPLDNSELRSEPKRFTTERVDSALHSTLMVLFERWPFEMGALPGQTYDAIDLLSYLSARPETEVGRGDWLIVTNIRGERQVFTRDELQRGRACLVVGLDDETNLHRVFVPYRLKQEYSWKKSAEPTRMMMRPLGAFLHFRSPENAPKNRSYAPFGLTPRSFRWSATDPLAAVRDLEGVLRDTVLGEQGCIKCHSLRGIDVKAHHVRAADAKEHGGFALALEDYPPDVLRRFLFEQEAVARSFDVAPLAVDPEGARLLHELVERERAKKN